VNVRANVTRFVKMQLIIVIVITPTTIRIIIILIAYYAEAAHTITRKLYCSGSPPES